MTIKEVIQNEVEHAKKVIQEEITNNNTVGYIEKFINDVNVMLDEVVFTHIRDSIQFDLINEYGDYYSTMLGKGKQCDYNELYEILTRLYKVHHHSQEFTIKFEEYTVDINIHNLSDNPTNRKIFNLLMNGINNNEKYIKISDFQ